MNLAYVDKFPEDNRDVNDVPVPQDSFNRAGNAKERETENSNEMLRISLNTITERNRPTNFGSTKAHNFMESSEELQNRRF